MSAPKPESLGFANARELLGQAEQIVAAGEIDLSAVQRVDSAGVSLLLELSRRAASAGKPLRLRGAPEQLRGLSAFFGVDSLLKFE